MFFIGLGVGLAVAGGLFLWFLVRLAKGFTW